METRERTALALLTLALIWGLSACGGDDNEPFIPPEPGDALIYTYPADGMVDVPVASKALVVFSSPVNSDAVKQNCTGTASEPKGAFCITGPDGPVKTVAQTRINNDGKTIEFTMGDLSPGQQYQLWIRPQAAPDAENLNAPDEPLLSFRTRQREPLAGEKLDVLAINQSNPDAFLEDSETPPRFPFLDISPVRLTFTEPLDLDAVVAGETISLVRVDEKDEQPVPVDMLAERHYITLQPKEDLLPDTRYEVRLTDEMRDLNGEHLEARTYVFTPRATKDSPEAENPPVKQTLQPFPAKGDANYPATSQLTGKDLNRFTLVNTALGRNVADTLPTGLDAYLADPRGFGGTRTPVVIRAGQQITLTGINPAKFGGEVYTDLNTGEITGTFVNNVIGFLTPNAYRPEGFQPDDERAPLYIYMDFDLALQTDNPNGNASLNQNLMHIQAVGIATIQDRTLTMEVFRTLELDVLGGATTISADFNLGAKSDPTIPVNTKNKAAPRITGTLPAHQEEGAETNENILLTFSEPMSTKGIDQISLLDMGSGGAEVPIQAKRTGTGVVVSPQERLKPATLYTLTLSPEMTDLHPFNPLGLAQAPDDALNGSGKLTFTTADYRRTENTDVSPILLALYPGIGCALADTEKEDGKAGRCMGGQPDDDLYRDFTYEVGRGMKAVFSQPMDTDSMRRGTINSTGDACEGGPICVAEQINGSWETVDTSLVAQNMALTLTPADGAIEAGQQYRLVVNGDSQPQLLSHPEQGGLVLNTTPLDSLFSAGGGNLVMDFNAIDDQNSITATVLTRPYPDRNGTGFLDDGERNPGNNYASASIEGTGGAITDASFPEGKDKIFINGGLPLCVSLVVA